MKYKMCDVINFISRVVYVQFDDSSILYMINDWLAEFGNIKVDVINVIEHADGTKTLVIRR